MADAGTGAAGPDLDLGRWLLRSFGTPGLAYPYVPRSAVPKLHVQSPSTAATFTVNPDELHAFNQAAGVLLAERADSRYAVSYGGHDNNPYAWTVLLQRPGLRLLAQSGFGGALADAPLEEKALHDLFTTIRDVDTAVPQGIRRDVLVLMSDLPGIRGTGWAPRTPAGLDRWLKQASTSHPLLVVDELIQRSNAWPERPTSPLRFTSRAARMAHEAHVADEWAARYPEAANGVSDPAADLALVLAMERWPELPAPHRWLPASVKARSCWWCFGEESDELHG